MTSMNSPELKEPFQELYNICKRSEKNLHAASEQMQNRGLKGLLKGFAQQRRRFARRLNDIGEQIGFNLSDPPSIRNRLERGWMDLRIAMIVGRANRQEAAIAECAEGERELLQAYEKVRRLPIPEFAQSEIQEQHESVQNVAQWLHRLSDGEKWIVRLYNNRREANGAVEQLKSSGFAENQIKVTPVQQLGLYADDDEERVHSTIDTMLAGTLFVAVIGAVLGLIAGFIRPLFDPAFPATPVDVWTSALGSSFVGALIGASFGSLFGVLLGQGVSEDDASVARRITQQDAVIVSVETTDGNYSNAAEILHVWHQREVEKVPA